MNISDKLNQQILLEVLLNIYNHEQELSNTNVNDVIIELKQQILSAISK